MYSRRPVALVAITFLAATTACSSLRPGMPGHSQSEGKLITAEDIERSGATNAWDALKHSGTHLSQRETASGEPSRLTYRGRSSIMLSPAPVVYVDGARTPDFGHLRQMPAHNIASIRVLAGIEGTRYYGTGGGNGVIVIQTKVSSDL
jgi:outer membrane cobalamin receptor